MPIKPPDLVYLCSGTAEGESELNAFDNALLSAGIGNWNLIKATSIVPPNAKILKVAPDIADGAIVPAVLTYITSDVPDDAISACLGLGRAEADGLGIIMEYADRCDKETSHAKVKKMIEDALKSRGLKLSQLVIVYKRHRVKKIGCALAAAILWWR